MSTTQIRWALILNLSPDSFSGDGLPAEALSQDTLAQRLDGADAQNAHWIDVGAVSTRPGSDPVSADEEWARLLPAIQPLMQTKEARRASARPLTISLDTSSPLVAEKAAALGWIDVINDVWAGRRTIHGQTTMDVAARYGCGLVLMHMRGEPKTMQQHPEYNHCIDEVAHFLDERYQMAKQRGVSTIYLDPGIGFGKRLEHNLELLSGPAWQRLRDIALIQGDTPHLLVGLSRKRFLHELFAATSKDSGIHPPPKADPLADPQGRDHISKIWEQQCIDHVRALDHDGCASELVVRSHTVPHDT
jgi:dihydropteroate synthase